MYTRINGTLDELMDALNGALRFPVPKGGLPLGGLTLDINTEVVTFPGGAGALVTPKAIVDTLNAADITGLVVQLRNHNNGYAIVIAHDALVVAETGTANALFGLSTDDPTTSAPVAANRIQLFTNTSNSVNYILVLSAP